MFQWVKRLFAKPQHTTYCYCPGCEEDLCSNGSFVTDEAFVYYRCRNCGTMSTWDFDMAPVPILLRESW